jgi:hypothetical protein
MSSINNNHQSQDFDDEDPRLLNLAAGPTSEFVSPFENDAFAQTHGQGAYARARYQQQREPVFRSLYELAPRNQQVQGPDWRAPGNLGVFGGFGAQPDMNQYQPYSRQLVMRPYQQDQPAFGSPYENAARRQHPQPDNSIYNPYMTGGSNQNTGNGTFNNNAPQSYMQNPQASYGGRNMQSQPDFSNQATQNPPAAYTPQQLVQQDLVIPVQPQQTAQPAAPAVHPDNMFKNLEKAIAAIPLPAWHCLQPDNTIPVTDADT